MMAALYDVGLPTINEHIKKIYADRELTEKATIRKFRIVQTEGTRQVNREVTHYNLQLKNYLNEQEMSYLERIVSLYLDYAELQAERKIPMSMENWAKRLDGFLEFNGNELLTRRTVAAILQGIRSTTFAMYRNNPEEFIAKVTRLIKEQKATMIVEHITYDTIEGSYDSSIFTAEKHALTMDRAYKAQKAIQDYVFTDGMAEKSVERRFAESLCSGQAFL